MNVACVSIYVSISSKYELTIETIQNTVSMATRKLKAVAHFNHLVPTLFFKFLFSPSRAFLIAL